MIHSSITVARPLPAVVCGFSFLSNSAYSAPLRYLLPHLNLQLSIHSLEPIIP